jgi:hypothetical protein
MKKIMYFVLLLLLSTVLTNCIDQKPMRYVSEDLEVEVIRQHIESFNLGVFVIDDHGNLYGMANTFPRSIVLNATGRPTIQNDHFPLNTNESFISIHASDSNGLAVTSTNRVFSWGMNVFGETGSELDETWVNSPVDISDWFDFNEGEQVAQIVMRSDDAWNQKTTSSFLLTTQGRLFGWGYNGLLSSDFYRLGTDSFDIIKESESYVPTPKLLNRFFELGDDEFIVSISPTSALTSYGRLFLWGQPESIDFTDITSAIGLKNNEYITKIDESGELYWTSQNRILAIHSNYEQEVYFSSIRYLDSDIEVSDVMIAETYGSYGNLSILLVSQQNELYARYGILGAQLGISYDDILFDELNQRHVYPITWSVDWLEGEHISEISIQSTHLLVITTTKRVLISGLPFLFWEIDQDMTIDFDLKELILNR